MPDGPLTSRLQHIQVGDSIIVGKKPTGTLLIDYLLPAKRLYLFSTGTGLAPFLSVIRDPETYERFEQVILVHGVREVAELAYHDYLTKELPQHEILGEMVRAQLKYYPTVTREPFRNQGRIPDLIESGKLAADLGLPQLNPLEDRAMLCGSPEMLASIKSLLEKMKFEEGNTTRPGDFVVGDADGVVIVPAELTVDVLEEVESLATTETRMREELLKGGRFSEVYDRYQVG